MPWWELSRVRGRRTARLGQARIHLPFCRPAVNNALGQPNEAFENLSASLPIQLPEHPCRLSPAGGKA
jgi:hypothetical protein